MITVYCDGACEPINPGGVPAWGYVVYADDCWTHEANGIRNVPEGTNNIAEYAAVIEALGYLAGMGLTRDLVEIRTDSRLIVNQCNGYWGVHTDHLELLLNEVRDLERRFMRVRYCWIPREQNELADLLSKAAYAEVM